MGHARLSPSASHQWLHCPGSVQAQELLPPAEETEDTLAGTAVHWVIESVLSSYYGGDSSLLTRVDFVGKPAPNGVIITDEMFDHSEVYTDTVLVTSQRHKMGSTVKIEERVEMPEVHAQCWGTPDTWCYNESDKVLYVYDFKYGHSYVDVVGNPQLMLYARGAMNELEIDGLNEQSLTVVMVIVQPRYYRDDPVREWVIKGSDLRGYINKLHYSASKAFDDNPNTVSGKHCKHCRALANCDTAFNGSLSLIQHLGDFDISNTNPDTLKEMIELMDGAKTLVTALSDSLNDQAEQLLVSGHQVKGLILENKYGNLAWDKDEQAVINIGKAFGVDVVKGVNLMTPQQAIKAGVPEDTVKSMAGRKMTGRKLKNFNIDTISEVFKENMK